MVGTPQLSLSANERNGRRRELHAKQHDRNPASRRSEGSVGSLVVITCHIIDRRAPGPGWMRTAHDAFRPVLQKSHCFHRSI